MGSNNQRAAAVSAGASSSGNNGKSGGNGHSHSPAGIVAVSAPPKGRSGNNGRSGRSKSPDDAQAAARDAMSEVVYEEGRIPLGVILIFAQARKKFLGISALARNIARRGLLEPPIIALFDWEHFRAYVELMNKLWDESYDPASFPVPMKGGRPLFTVNTEAAWPVLIAGERRCRALGELWENSCKAWISELGPQTVPGEHFCQRHCFEEGQIRVRFAMNPRAVTAVYVQTSENIHRALRPEEEAGLAKRLFQTCEEEGVPLVLQEVAAEFGLSEDAIRDRLTYSRLPSCVREAVELGILDFTAAIHFAHWIEKLKPENEVVGAELAWATREKRTSRQIGDRLRCYTKAAEAAEPMLLIEMMSAAAISDQRKHDCRNGVRDSTLRIVTGLIERLSAIVWLFRAGVLKPVDSPFRLRNVLALHGQAVRTVRDLNRHLETLLPPEVVEATRQELQYSERLAALLEEKAEKQS